MVTTTITPMTLSSLKILILFSFFTIFQCQLNLTQILFPLPANITLGNETHYLNKYCKFNFESIEHNEKLHQILSIYSGIINQPQFHFTRSFFPVLNNNNDCKIKVNIKVNNPVMQKYSSDYKNEHESYAIKIAFVNITDSSRDLDIQIDSLYLNGIVRSLETLSQLLFYNEQNSRYEIYNLPLFIFDTPNYSYRGVMIDTSRHFISVNKIKELINGMMYSKLNVLHWHLTDDEYFGFGSDLLKGNLNYVYTKSQMKEIKDYAFIRGVTVIAEIDNPSHTRSWKDVEKSVVITKPEYGTLDPSKNLTYKIVGDILKETIKVFSEAAGDFVHLGGDEVLSSMWSGDGIKEFMQRNKLNNITELENFYFNKVRKNLPSDKNYIYWISDQEKRHKDVYDMPESVLMYWGLSNLLKKHLDNFPNQSIQRKLILTPADYLYLDCGSGNKYGSATWCGDYKTWKTIYNLPIFKQHNNFIVLGSAVVLFGELADENSFIGKIFPRAFALADRLWSERPSDIKNIFVRLIQHNKRLKNRNVGTISFTTQLCENEPYECIDNI